LFMIGDDLSCRRTLGRNRHCISLSPQPGGAPDGMKLARRQRALSRTLRKG
jgi:hypothetical protein